jgi:hypothetical protein
MAHRNPFIYCRSTASTKIMSVSPEHNWEAYSYQTDNGPVVVGFHADSDKINRESYPYCARVLVSIKAPDRNGGPSQDEAKTLWDMEDRLVAALDTGGVPCKMLGRLTHGGIRELVFQVADYTPFRPPVGVWMSKHPEYEIDVSEHDGWEFFIGSVWPSATSWMLIMDRRVVDNLIRSGSDPTKTHSLEFVFRGDSARLQGLQAVLGARGYSLLNFAPEESLLVMAATYPLHLPTIYRESISHRDECARLDLEYDGWGASVVT